MSLVRLFLPFDQLLLLIREVYELVQGFLVDVAVLFEFSVTLVQFFEELLEGQVGVLLKRIARKRAQLSDLTHALFFLQK